MLMYLRARYLCGPGVPCTIPPYLLSSIHTLSSGSLSKSVFRKRGQCSRVTGDPEGESELEQSSPKSAGIGSRDEMAEAGCQSSKLRLRGRQEFTSQLRYPCGNLMP